MSRRADYYVGSGLGYTNILGLREPRYDPSRLLEIATEVLEFGPERVQLPLQRCDSILQIGPTHQSVTRCYLPDLRLDVLGLSAEQLDPPPPPGRRHQGLITLLQLTQDMFYFFWVSELMHPLRTAAELAAGAALSTER